MSTKGDILISDRMLVDMDKPSNYKEAMVGPKATKWKESMESEIRSM